VFVLIEVAASLAWCFSSNDSSNCENFLEIGICSEGPRIFDRVRLGALLFYLENHAADFIIVIIPVRARIESNSSGANVGTAQEYFCFLS
jgi:hypothetical protein